MTDVQIPLQHQNHQKAMNGKYSPKNLEIRGFSGNTNNNSNQLVSVGETKTTNSNAIGSAAKKSLKIIDKSAPSTNFQVLRFNPNNEFGTLVSVIDVNPNITNKNRTSFNNNNSSNNKNTTIIPSSDLIQINSTQSLNLLNNMNTNLSSGFLTSNLTSNNNKNNLNTTNLTSQINNTNLTNSSPNNHISSNRVNQFWNDESNSGWTGTGVMSDRSSVYSIDDGDFDREASRKVNSQLREIESILYEQNSTQSSQQKIECNEWLEKFPHIRILGKQILNRDDCLSDTSMIRSSVQSLQISSLKGMSSNLTNVTSSISSNLSSSSNIINNNTNKLEIASTSPPLLSDNLVNSNETTTPKYFRRRENSDLNNQLLNVYGTCLPIRTIVEDDLTSDDFTSFEEEIFDQEGIYEELLAYDNQEEEYLFEHNKRLNLSKRRRHGLPPITPKAAMKDLVLNFLFDHMWSELIDWSAETIKAYAKTVSEDFIFSDDSACKTPRLVSTPNMDDTLFNNNNNNNLDSNKSTSNTINNNSSSSYSSLNNPYPTNETISSNTAPTMSISTTTNINNNNNNNNNNMIIPANTNNAIATTTNVTKANIIQLKLFDSQFSQSNLYPIQSYTPSLLQRDNSYLYKNSNSQNSDSITNNDTLGDLMTKDLLQIKQINRNSSSTSSNNTNANNTNNNTNSANKALNPIILGSQSRVNSGNRRQYQINYYRKRYSSIEMAGTNTNSSISSVDKNIIIHGAGLSKPSSLNQNTNTNDHLIDTKSATSNNAIPFQLNNSRSTTSTSQAYNHQMVNDENIYENDYNDYNLYENGENSIDEINLINQNQPLNAKQLNVVNAIANHHHSHLNYFGFHQHNNAITNTQANHNNFQQLPPIENSLTLKPIRISSANINNNTGLKQIKERNERPMTSTATRFDLNGIPAINKRSTTPSGLTSANKSALNKKFNNIRQSPDDSIFINNFLSTKSFNFLINNNNNTGNITTSSNATPQNRRNSIKDSHSLTRIYR